MAAINFNEMSDEAILKEIGKRLKNHRLDLVMTQEDITTKTNRATSTIKNLESGIGTLASFVSSLRAINALEQLNNMLPAPGVSPMLLLRQPKPRQRARGSKNG